MDALARLQPLDLLMVVVWAAIIGWGLQSGIVRQLGMLIGVYAAAVVASAAYRPGGQLLSMAFGSENRPQLEFVAYVVVFVLVLSAIGLLIWRAYPLARLSRQFGLDNIVGGLVGAVWGTLLLIALVTVLRFYAATPWRGQEASQQSVNTQVHGSQLTPVLEVVLSPLWQAMTPWFPGTLPPRTS